MFVLLNLDMSARKVFDSHLKHQLSYYTLTFNNWSQPPNVTLQVCEFLQLQ